MRKSNMIFFAFVAMLVGCSSATPKTTTTVSTASPTEKSVSLLKAVTPGYKENFAQGAKVKIGYKTDQQPDSVVVTVDGERLQAVDLTFAAPTDRVGRVSYSVKAFKGGQSQTMNGEFTVLAATKPKIQKIAIVRKYPHNKDSYTQGLLYHDSKLYESTGEYGRSALQIVDVESGKILKSKSLDKKYFGEGLELLNGKLYQLTWEQGVVFVYDVNDFEKVTQFPIVGEGWGITTDGKYLYVSNGSNVITKYDPEKFTKVSQFEVADNLQKLNYINEMEWIDGRIWANVYTTNVVAVINPQSGVVERYVDCSLLEQSIGNQSTADVLNGIAYHAKSGRIWMTGKNWDTLFEVKVVD